MSTKQKGKGIANILCCLIEAILIDCAKYSAWVACASLFFMSVEWINSAPVNFKQALFHSVSMTILLGLVLALITSIKWAWRKHQACKGG
ncbi:TPA: hypothetical protein RQN05_000797 [Aeromonas dhakensis]|nr:hypothetical protein [Aeromonas dhakensis]